MPLTTLSKLPLSATNPNLSDWAIGVTSGSWTGTPNRRFTFQQIANAIGGGIVNPGGVPVIGNFASLLAINPGTAATSLYYLSGYHNAGDGGAGFFLWNSGSTATADGGTIVNPTGNSGAGRFIRQLPEERVIFPDYWGGYGDNTHDDFAALLSAIAWTTANGTGEVRLVCGQSYICNQPLLIRPDECILNLNWGMINFANSGGSLKCITLALDSAGDGIQANEHIAIRNGYLFGSGPAGSIPNTSPTETMVALHASVLTIENVYVWQTGRAFDIQAQSFLVTIRECGVQGSYSGVSSINGPLNSAENCKAVDCTFTGCYNPIDWGNDGNNRLEVVRCSFDFNDVWVNNSYGRVDCVDCHFEVRNAPPSGRQGFFINTGGDSKTVVVRPVLSWDQYPITSLPYLCDSTPSFPFGVFIYDPVIYPYTLGPYVPNAGWSTGGNRINSGSGYAVVSTGYAGIIDAPYGQIINTPPNIGYQSAATGLGTSGGFALFGGPNGTGVLPVPTLRPTTANTEIAFDLCPNGSPTDLGYGLCWFDLCNTDQLTGGDAATQTVHIATHSAYHFIGSAEYSAGTILPLHFGIFDGDTPLETPSFIINSNGTLVFYATQQSGIPSTSNLAAGQWGVFKDTSGGGVTIAYNDAGTIKKATLT